MRVLIADDSAVARNVLESTLTGWGYSVVMTCDGTEAWEAIRNDDGPKLAILDWVMPGMDGVEVCRKIRKRKSDRYVYVILLTANDSSEDLVRGMESGADDYIGRYGGEEFLIILPGCDEPNTERVTERLRAAIAKNEMVVPEGKIAVTMSMGAASTAALETFDLTALIRAADAALYRAKRAGRNCVRLAEAIDCKSAGEEREGTQTVRVPPLCVR